MVVTGNFDYFNGRYGGNFRSQAGAGADDVVTLLDKEARRLGVPRQSIIKVWVAERLEKAF